MSRPPYASSESIKRNYANPRPAMRLRASGPKNKQGLFRQFSVTRIDPSAKHRACTYFVIDEEHDKFAGPALNAYADACAKSFPDLAEDLRTRHPQEKPICVIGKYCEFHEYVHGAEAEELRSRLELFIKQFNAEIPEDLSPEDLGDRLQNLGDRLQKILDEVDARDTCDFVQIKPQTGRAGAWRGQNEHAVRARPKRKAKAKK